MFPGSQLPEFVKEAVLLRSESLEGLRPIVSGYDFCNGVDYHKMFASYACTGFQATNVGKAFEEINKMVELFFLDEILVIIIMHLIKKFIEEFPRCFFLSVLILLYYLFVIISELKSW